MRKSLTRAKASRIGRKRVFANTSRKQSSASRYNGKKAMRVARRRSSIRRSSGKGYIDTNYEYTIEKDIDLWFGITLACMGCFLFLIAELIITDDYYREPVVVFFAVCTIRGFMKYKRLRYTQKGMLSKVAKTYTNLLNFLSSCIFTYTVWSYLLDINYFQYSLIFIGGIMISKAFIGMCLSVIVSLISTIIHRQYYKPNKIEVNLEK